MSEYKIKTFPSNILRKKAAKVIKVTEKERSILDAMARTMYLNSGVGLAAVQVGIDMQMAVVDVGAGLIKLINPSVVSKEGRESCEEGCLSVPGLVVNVKRAKRIVVSFLDENGHVARMKAAGLLARAIQHEIDHLAGKLIVDYLDPIRRMLRQAQGSVNRFR